ncbi:MAG TPA: hypothetical protein PKD24_05670 [Pyrinomonadaceae bacterium]|nr:hypothetical protein [Pyrinomonadaceae bacterium]HMP65039.1 hypothetical protein [Pyrinomonadaceae bacterium]
MAENDRKRKKPTYEARTEKALAALLRSGSVAAAARSSGIPERSLYRMLNDPEFSGVLRERRQRAAEASVGLVQAASDQAIATLLRLIACGKPAIEARSASYILAHFRWSQENDIAARLETLEHAIFGAKKSS